MSKKSFNRERRAFSEEGAFSNLNKKILDLEIEAEKRRGDLLRLKMNDAKKSLYERQSDALMQNQESIKVAQEELRQAKEVGMQVVEKWQKILKAVTKDRDKARLFLSEHDYFLIKWIFQYITSAKGRVEMQVIYKVLEPYRSDYITLLWFKKKLQRSAGCFGIRRNGMVGNFSC